MLPLARSLARRYAGKGEPLDDLEQVASLGLLKAIDRFDVSRDVRFATFAVPTIAGEIKRHFRDRGWMLRVPRELQELSARVVRAREALTARARPLADASRSSPARSARGVEQVLEALRARRRLPHDVARRAARRDGAGALEAIGGDDDGLRARRAPRAAAPRPRRRCAEREREIVRLRFYEGLTQREIARAVGVSQMHVSRLIRRSIDAMRDSIEPVARAA